MSQWLTPVAGEDSLIAWSRHRQWRRSDFRRDVATLLARIQPLSASRYALCFSNSYYFSVALLAVIYSGKTPVLPGHQRPSLLAEQLADFDALLTDTDLPLPCPTLSLPSSLEGIPRAELPDFPQDASLILFTSGSTGKPQEIIKTLVSLNIESQWLAQSWGATLQRTRIAATVSSQHMFGLTFRVILPLALSLPFYADSLEVHEQLADMAQQFPLTLISSPAFLTRLDENMPPLSCTQIFSAGGALSTQDAAQVHRLCGVCPIDIYGTTETGILAHRQSRCADTPWRLFDGVSLHAEHENIIHAFSDLISQPTGLALSDNLQLAEDRREFRLLGRKDRIVKIAEQRLSLDEIEHRLCQLPVVDQACVLTIDKKGRSFIAAAIVLSREGVTQLQPLSQVALGSALRQMLRPWLSPVALPRFWRVLPALPLNPQGKLAYADLQELFL